MPTALVVVLVLVAAVFAPAAGEEMPGDEVSGEEEGAHRSCGTLEPTVQEREYQKKKLIEFRRIQPEAARAARLDFKVVVHIIHDGDTGKYVPVSLSAARTWYSREFIGKKDGQINLIKLKRSEQRGWWWWWLVVVGGGGGGGERQYSTV